MFEDYLRPRQSFHDKHILDLSRDAIDRSRELLLRTRPARRRAAGIQARIEDLKYFAGAHQEVVILDAADGEWCVAVYELFQEPIFRTFGEEAMARIFAITQRKRLGLKEVTNMLVAEGTSLAGPSFRVQD